MSSGAELIAFPGAAPAGVDAGTLERELEWFDAVLQARICLHFKQPCEHADVREIGAPELAGDSSPYARLVLENRMGFSERIVLALALLPHLYGRPLLDTCCSCATRTSTVASPNSAAWKSQRARRLPAHRRDGRLRRRGRRPGAGASAVLAAASTTRTMRTDPAWTAGGDARASRAKPRLAGALVLSSEYLCNASPPAERHKPDYSSSQFPAKLITTAARLGRPGARATR
jgi:hypothetical protein